MERVLDYAPRPEFRNCGRQCPIEFLMSIKHKDTGLDETVTVVFTSFSKTHVARGAFDMWDMSISMEEC